MTTPATRRAPTPARVEKSPGADRCKCAPGECST